MQTGLFQGKTGRQTLSSVPSVLSSGRQLIKNCFLTCYSPVGPRNRSPAIYQRQSRGASPGWQPQEPEHETCAQTLSRDMLATWGRTEDAPISLPGVWGGSPSSWPSGSSFTLWKWALPDRDWEICVSVCSVHAEPWRKCFLFCFRLVVLMDTSYIIFQVFLFWGLSFRGVLTRGC